MHAKVVLIHNENRVLDIEIMLHRFLVNSKFVISISFVYKAKIVNKLQNKNRSNIHVFLKI